MSEQKHILELHFPRLKDDNYSITSPKTICYNCIAWAAGESDRWWWPSSEYYWPEELKECTLGSFIRVFEAMEYKVCNNALLEEGFEKVAIFTEDSIPTHMARQLISGDWTSKCGNHEDISHNLYDLESLIYGEVKIIMKRQRNDNN